MTAIETRPEEIKKRKENENILGEFSPDEIWGKSAKEIKAENNIRGNNEIVNENEKVNAPNVADNTASNDNIEIEVLNENEEIKEQAKISVRGAEIVVDEKGLDKFAPLFSLEASKDMTKEEIEQLKKKAILELICPEPGVYDKDELDIMLKTIESKDRDGAFNDVVTLTKILTQSGIPFNSQENIIVKDNTTRSYTIYFVGNSETYTIPDEEFESSEKEDLLLAKNIEELKEKISRGIAREEDNKSVVGRRSTAALQQDGRNSNEIEK